MTGWRRIVLVLVAVVAAGVVLRLHGQGANVTLWGTDSTGTAHQVLVDTTGHPIISVSGGTISPSLVKLGDGTAGAPSLTFASETTTGLFRQGTAAIGVALGSANAPLGFDSAIGFRLANNFLIGWSSTTSNAFATIDTILARDVANTLALKNGTNAQTFRVYGTTSGNRFIDTAAANLITAPTDSTEVTAGSLTRFREQSTITPASGGAGNCGAAFLAASLTADCTIATLPAGSKLVAIYADVTAGFTCSGTCTGTKVVQCGSSAGAVDILAAGFNVAATGTAGLTDATLGSAMVRAAAIQGGFLPSWSATTTVSCRFTSGTGNWGSGAATFVNAGSVKFTLVTEQVK